MSTTTLSLPGRKLASLSLTVTSEPLTALTVPSPRARVTADSIWTTVAVTVTVRVAVDGGVGVAVGVLGFLNHDQPGRIVQIQLDQRVELAVQQRGRDHLVVERNRGDLDTAGRGVVQP